MAASGRWGNFEDEMFTLRNRDGQAMCLAPSHEEGVVHLVDGLTSSRTACSSGSAGSVHWSATSGAAGRTRN